MICIIFFIYIYWNIKIYGLIYLYSDLCLYLFIYGRCMHVDIGLFIYVIRYLIIYVIIYTNIYNIYKKKEIYRKMMKNRREIYKYIRKVRETD